MALMMFGKKHLSDIRASLLDECAKAGMDPAVWFDEQIYKLKSSRSPNTLEIDTLQLIRDGLQAELSPTKPVRKRIRTRSAD